jgi:hypothetical protein
MKVASLRIKCPKCGSGKVAYSCEPDCCFNHVCEDCLASFQLATRDLGSAITGLAAPPDHKDSCAPTVKCARCQSLDVRSVDGHDASDPTAACVVCGAVLELVYQ